MENDFHVVAVQVHITITTHFNSIMNSSVNAITTTRAAACKKAAFTFYTCWVKWYIINREYRKSNVEKTQGTHKCHFMQEYSY